MTTQTMYDVRRAQLDKLKHEKPAGLSVVDEFLWESNAIEDEFSPEAFEDAKYAWKYAKGIKDLSHKDILEIHRILMGRLRPDIAGKWRFCAVKIGGKVKNFVSWPLLESQVMDCCLATVRPAKYRFVPEKEREKLAKKAHVMFEDVHPFEDGNGRVGRIIWQWHRRKMGLPIAVIPHEGRGLWDYMGWFNNR